MTLMLEDTDVFTVIDTLDLHEPDCDNCGTGTPRWRGEKLCCEQMILLCEPCHSKILMFEAAVALSGKHFHCMTCDTEAATLPELIRLTPLT